MKSSIFNFYNGMFSFFYEICNLLKCWVDAIYCRMFNLNACFLNVKISGVRGEMVQGLKAHAALPEI